MLSRIDAYVNSRTQEQINLEFSGLVEQLYCVCDLLDIQMECPEPFDDVSSCIDCWAKEYKNERIERIDLNKLGE